jgi:hypothetical protein
MKYTIIFYCILFEKLKKINIGLGFCYHNEKTENKSIQIPELFACQMSQAEALNSTVQL